MEKADLLNGSILSRSDHAMESSGHDSELSQSVLRLLISSTPSSVIATAVNSLILAFVLWNHVANEWIVAWLIAMTLALSCRLMLFVRAKIRGYRFLDRHKWLQYLRSLLFLTGLVWGSASVFLFPHDLVAHQSFLAFVIAGMSAGAVSTLTVDLTSFRLYIIPAAIPLVVQHVLMGTEIGYAMAVMTTLFFLIINIAARRINVNITENIALRLITEEHTVEIENKQALLEQTNVLAKVLGWQWNASTNKLTWTLSDNRQRDIPMLKCQTFSELVNYFDPECRDGLVAAWKACVAEDKDIDWEGSKVIDERSVIWFRLVATCRRRDGEVYAVIGSVLDISPYKVMEKMKAEFVSVVSHELRTPLTSINGSLKLLLSGTVVSIPSDAVELLQIAERNGDRLLALINDLLDVEKLGSGKMTLLFEPVYLNDLLPQIIEETKIYADQYNVRFRLETLPNKIVVKADRQRLMQVMANLLSNAAKFSKENSEVIVRVEEKNGRARVSVIDKGIGIPEEFRDRIFQRFSQADSSSTRLVGGTGLGLNIVKSLIEKMGGTVGYDSVVNQGTTFYFELSQIIQK